MKIALLGYGKMGKEIERIALERNHEIVLVIDADNIADFTIQNLQKAEVAIDFSTPGSAFTNIMQCFEAGIPVVCGTTGWIDRLAEVREVCQHKKQAFFYASNYSLGVNVFFALNRFLADIMDQLDNYEVWMKEIHHIHKLDAPSGTAISLAGDIIAALQRKQQWELDTVTGSKSIRITAVREDEVPGTHIVTYDSEVDRIEISHTAKNRKGLALGAVHAAEFIRDKKGIFEMKDMIRL
jgi:4-hydroxy-tetrahydrodipicolinate reductase